jgi:hypothetical protein
VTTLRDLLKACDVTVRSHLDPHEQVLAVGRCEDITVRGNTEGGGAAWTYIMVTDRRLRWVARAKLRFEASLDLDSVTTVSERLNGHRYAIALEHPAVMRLHWVPAHRFLLFQWGNAEATIALSRTELAFSRRDTDAAVALRGQLARRCPLGTFANNRAWPTSSTCSRSATTLGVGSCGSSGRSRLPDSSSTVSEVRATLQPGEERA